MSARLMTKKAGACAGSPYHDHERGQDFLIGEGYVSFGYAT